MSKFTRNTLAPDALLQRRLICAAGGLAVLGLPAVAGAQIVSGVASAAASAPAAEPLTKDEWLAQYFGTKAFGSPLAVSRFLDRIYYLIRDLTWTATGTSKPLGKIVVPTGFVTDFASVPRPFWALLPTDDEYVTAAVIHDWLYWNQATTREKADQALKDSMIELGVSSLKVTAIYEGVNLFGGSAWSENARLKADGERRVLKQTPEDLRVRWKEWKLKPGVFV